jgi:RNA polymerase sigma-70 factor (ECF subfamily)
MISQEKITEIYELYGKELISYIYRFVKSQETAEDILHDCFVNLMRYTLQHEVREGSLRAFLYKTAHNLSLNQLKKQGRSQPFPLGEEMVRDDTPDFTRRLENEELGRTMERIIDLMEPEWKSIFLMRKISGMTYGEISKNLGISDRTVKRRMRDIIDFLAVALKKHGYLILSGLFLTLG